MARDVDKWLAECGIKLSALIHIRTHQAQIDSRAIKPGDLFVALKGSSADGRDFIPQAIQRGAVAIVAESNNKKVVVEYSNNVPVIAIPQLHKRLSRLMNAYYHHPEKQLTLVGVTGTNGKTTITHLLAQWIKLLGEKSAVMGTNGNGVIGRLSPAINTTPSAVDVQRTLADFVEEHVDVAAMEISSHGLEEGRIDGLDFDAVVFSNLSRDHLDFHHTIEAYKQAKWQLFSAHKSTVQVVNIDDPVGKEWFDKLLHSVAVSTSAIPLGHDKKWLCATNITTHPNGAAVEINSSWGNATLHSPLIGNFNTSNLLLALATLLSLGYPLSALIETAIKLQGAEGRMELFIADEKPAVIVDYAHTPDALEKVIKSARDHCSKNLWCVFGCGGDRDKGKRALMGGIASAYADRVVITNDNPRGEDHAAIIDDILSGITDRTNVEIMPDRTAAIITAISAATPGDMVVIAGKGHENYQIVGHERIHHDDREIVASLLGITS